MEFSKKMVHNAKVDDIFSKINQDKFRSLMWYFFIPFFLFVVLSPGLIISLPPVKDCDDRISKALAPGRVTFYNTIVHAVVFIVLVFGIYLFGSRNNIAFPFCASSLKMA